MSDSCGCLGTAAAALPRVPALLLPFDLGPLSLRPRLADRGLLLLGVEPRDLALPPPRCDADGDGLDPVAALLRLAGGLGLRNLSL